MLGSPPRPPIVSTRRMSARPHPRTKPHRGPARRPGRRVPLYAAIDLGTNNCRLLIAAPRRDGGLRVVDSFSRIVRLGEGLAHTGTLGDAAIARTVDALTVCAARMKKHGVAHVRAIATEAARAARNADVLLARVSEATGIALDIVSPEEEARLAAVGCAPLVGDAYRGALVFDIGGGSTELIWIARANESLKPLFSASVPVGVVSLAEARRGVSYTALTAELHETFAQLRWRMERAGAFVPAANHLLGTSGTVTTLAAVALGLKRYLRARVDASWHKTQTILDVADRLAGLSLEARRAMPCIGRDRADLMMPGCAIFRAIQAHWPCPELRVADRGLREGMLRELIAETRA